MSRYSMNRRQSLQPSCPLGGKWYACEAGSKFVGCCDNDPCNLGCKQGNLEPASFNKAYYGQFSDLECSSGMFYTCKFTNPPFMGCCKSNPCSKGCPSKDLAGAYLGHNEATSCHYFDGGCASVSPTTTASASGSSASGSSANGSRVSASQKSSIGPIVGGAIGGGAALVVFAILLFYCYRHTGRFRKVGNGGVDPRNSQQTANSWTGTTDVSSEKTTQYQAYEPSGKVASPFSTKQYPPQHAHPHFHQIVYSPLAVSELPSETSPAPPYLSPLPQPRPCSYELSATSPLYTNTNSTPALGLGLNAHPVNQAQHWTPASPSIISRPPVSADSISPDLSESSAYTPTKKHTRVGLARLSSS